MDAINAGSQDEFCGDDSHGLSFEVVGNALDDGAVVEEALLADADIGGEARLCLFLGTKRWDIAGWGFRQAGYTTSEVQ